MPRIIYENERGQSIVLGDSAPLMVTKMDGLGSLKNELQRQKAPYQDGSTITGVSLSDRELIIEGVILAADKEIYRRQLLQAFNPKLKGTLRYEKGSIVKEIGCSTELAPAFPSDFSKNYQVFLITLLCPSPFWLDTFYEGEEMAYIMGGLKFRLSLPTSFSNRGFKRKANNEGDVETPVLIEFKGPAVNPTVTNETTGEYIKIKRELGEQDVLTLSTAFGQKYVRINGENAFHYIDLASTFWQLQPGENILSYTSNNDSINTRVTVKWKNRYIGL